MESRSGLILKGKWILTRYLAKGACAEIWAVSCDDATAKSEKRDKCTGWIAKIVPEPSFLTAAAKKKVRKATDIQLNAQALNWERTLYRSILRGHDSIPHGPLRDDYGTQDGIRFLIMERLGQNLGEYFVDQNRHLSNATISNYGKQMLAALRQCHERKVIFIDVKPENFMLGYSDENTLYIADFGVAKKYIDSKGVHQGSAGGSGTLLYMSLRCQELAPVSRRDDLESLAYVLIELLLGKLPWAESRSEKELMNLKKGTDVKALCSSFPAGEHLWEFCQRTRALGFEDTPDYDGLEALLSAVASCSDTTCSKHQKKISKKPAVANKMKEAAEEVSPKHTRRKVPLKEAAEDIEEPDIKKSKTAKVQKKKEIEVIEVAESDEDDALPSMKENKKQRAKRVAKKSDTTVHESHATASASATVTYTYTAPKRRSRRLAVDSDDEEEPETSYTATVTVTATAKASHPIPTL